MTGGPISPGAIQKNTIQQLFTVELDLTAATFWICGNDPIKELLFYYETLLFILLWMWFHHRTDPDKSKCYISHHFRYRAGYFIFLSPYSALSWWKWEHYSGVLLNLILLWFQSSAGKAGCSLPLATLFCQHYFKRLQYNRISMNMLFWCVLFSLLWNQNFILAVYCSTYRDSSP